jgi:alanyl-tRNA synthetase
MLEKKLSELKAEGKSLLEGAEAFKLYDTYGFPVDLTREIAQEAGLSLDEEGFTALMNEQKSRARAARGNISGWSKESLGALTSVSKTEFLHLCIKGF